MLMQIILFYLVFSKVYFSQNEEGMKKKLVIEKCCNCPFYKRIAVKNEALKAVCFGRNKVYYLLNDTESSIPEDCPLETIEESN